MRQLTIILCLLMAMLTSCQSQHERQVQMLNDLIADADHYDKMPNDSLARAALYYMERHGTPRVLWPRFATSGASTSSSPSTMS